MRSKGFIALAIFMATLVAVTFYKAANAACIDDPNNPNNGWCVPAPGGQACEITAGSCNCTCDQRGPIIA